MDYEQHMPGRSSYDPSRAYMQTHRAGGVGGVAILVGIIVVALALVVWMAGSNTGGDAVPASAEHAAPADPAAAPAVTE